MEDGLTEMVERVARALAKEEGYAYDPFPYDARARAAIEAMRDPTEEMLDFFIYPTNECDDPDFKAIWQLMIDSALQNQPIDFPPQKAPNEV